MSFELWLGVVGLGVGIIAMPIGWVISRYYYRRSLQIKRLAISFTQALPLASPTRNVTFIYDGEPREAVSRVYFLLWNRGHAAIELQDFVEPISFAKNDDILSLRVIEKSELAKVTIDHKENAIHINLLRPGEAVVFEVDAATEQYRPDVSVKMKSDEMNILMTAQRAEFPLMSAVALGIATAVVLTLLAPSRTTITDTVTKAGYPGFLGTMLAVVLLACIIGVSVFVGRTTYKYIRYRLIKTTPSVAWRFFERKLAVAQAKGYWDSFKEKSALLD